MDKELEGKLLEVLNPDENQIKEWRSKLYDGDEINLVDVLIINYDDSDLDDTIEESISSYPILYLIKCVNSTNQNNVFREILAEKDITLHPSVFVGPYREYNILNY